MQVWRYDPPLKNENAFDYPRQACSAFKVPDLDLQVSKNPTCCCHKSQGIYIGFD